METDKSPPEPPGVLEGYTLDERYDEFFRLLNEGHYVRTAAKMVALSPNVVYRKRKEDPEFAQRWADARKHPVEELESEALRRAMNGSDKLLMFMLSNLAPEKYKTARQEASGNVSLNVLTGLPDSPVDDLV